MAPPEKILIVDDERFIRMALGEALRSWSYETYEAESVAEAKQRFDEVEPDVVLLDIDLPDGSGLDVLGYIKEKRPETIAVMITGNVDVPNLLKALRNGAHDFISKPAKMEELRVTLRNAVETRSLRREVKLGRRERARGFSFSQIIGDSAPLKRLSTLHRGSRHRTFQLFFFTAKPGQAKTFSQRQFITPPSARMRHT